MAAGKLSRVPLHIAAAAEHHNRFVSHEKVARVAGVTLTLYQAMLRGEVAISAAVQDAILRTFPYLKANYPTPPPPVCTPTLNTLTVHPAILNERERMKDNVQLVMEVTGGMGVRRRKALEVLLNQAREGWFTKEDQDFCLK